MKNCFAAVATFAFVLGIAADSAADGFSFDFMESTPVGSWQVREIITTDHKGKKTLSDSGDVGGLSCNGSFVPIPCDSCTAARERNDYGANHGAAAQADES